MSKGTKTYRYSGPPSGMTLREGKATREVLLFPGKDVELPTAHPQVAVLVARGHLHEVEAARSRKRKSEKETS